MIRRIASLLPDVRIAVLSDTDEEEYRVAAFESGARFFFSKCGSNGHNVLRRIMEELIG